MTNKVTMIMCSSTKYPYPPPWKVTTNSGSGGSRKKKFYSFWQYEAKLDFGVEGGSNQKNLLWISSGTNYYNNIVTNYWQVIQLFFNVSSNIYVGKITNSIINNSFKIILTKKAVLQQKYLHYDCVIEKNSKIGC